VTKIISPKSARTLALCGDHSNYTFEQAGYEVVASSFTCKYRNRGYVVPRRDFSSSWWLPTTYPAISIFCASQPTCTSRCTVCYRVRGQGLSSVCYGLQIKITNKVLAFFVFLICNLINLQVDKNCIFCNYFE
jgi:hypothetical protein